jgi:U3 small nucleolar ribonucleoprotein component
MLSLNKLQVLAIMCEADVDEGLVNYWKFIPLAAKSIEAMFEPSAMAQRASLLNEDSLSDAALMQGKERAEIEDMIRQRFKEADTDGGGSLDSTEFTLCMESLELGLNRKQINALLCAADADGSGDVDEEEVSERAHGHHIHISTTHPNPTYISRSLSPLPTTSSCT